MVDTPTGILTGWVPVTPPTYYTPLAGGVGTGGICGCELPDGRGLIMWHESGIMRGALCVSPSAWLGNSVIPTIDHWDADPSYISAGRVSCFVHGGEVWAVRSGQQFSSPFVASLTVWQANDPANPDTAGWTQVATIHTVTAGGSGGVAAIIAGIPHWHAGAGHYVLAGNATTALGGSSYGSSIGVWTAPTLGGTWTRRLTAAMPGIGGPFNYLSSQMAETAAGTLRMFVSHTSGTQPNRIYDSANGTSWGLAASNTTPVRWSDFLWNGTELYTSAGSGPDVLTTVDTDPDTWGDWFSTGELWAPSGQGGDVASSQTRHLVLCADGVHAFWLNRVAFTPGPSGGWVIGAAPIGTQVQSGWQ